MVSRAYHCLRSFLCWFERSSSTSLLVRTSGISASLLTILTPRLIMWQHEFVVSNFWIFSFYSNVCKIRQVGKMGDIKCGINRTRIIFIMFHETCDFWRWFPVNHVSFGILPSNTLEYRLSGWILHHKLSMVNLPVRLIHPDSNWNISNGS